MTQFIKPVPASKPTKTKKYTSARILFVLDKSSSMYTIKNETVDGFNAFLSEQKNFKQKATISLVTFSDPDKVEYVLKSADLETVEPLKYNDFIPSGWTALYDGVGRTITDALASKQKKSEKTVLAILTDGEENRSNEFNNSSVRALIEQVQKEHGWEVIFIGANINAENVGTGMGVLRSKTATFDFTGKGVADVMKTAAYSSNSSRGMDYAFMSAEGSAGMLEGVTGVNINTMYAAVSKGLDEKLKADVAKK